VTIVEGKIMPRAAPERAEGDPPVFILMASPTYAPWLPDTSFQKVNIGSAGQVLAVQADGSVNWQNSAAGFANPMTTTGDMIFSNPGSTPVRLAIGANGTVLTVAGGVPTWTPNSAVGFANPMTSVGDTIIGGAAGAATRLAAGTNGQVLTLTAGSPAWVNSAAGFANPMTTPGDIIIENNSSVPARLAVGAANQVLTSVGGLPAWANSASGFANPMTQAGDLITGGLVGAAQRLAVGATGQVLTVVAGAPAWTAGATGASAVVFPSGDTTGVTDQANITSTWTSGLVANGGEVLLASGQFYVKPTSGLNCLAPPVQTVSPVQGNPNGGWPVCLRGVGASTVVYPVGAGVTGIFYHRSSTYGGQYGLAAQPQTGFLKDFVIDGTFSSGASIGVDWGDGWGYELDLGVVNFDTTGAIGVQQINRHFWTEKNDRIRLRLGNNSTAFYITSALVPGGDISSEYNMYDVSMFCNANQQGVVVDGCNMGGSYMWIRGNMSVSNGSGAAPPGNIAALSIINAAGASISTAHRWYAGGFYIKVEGNPGNGSGSTFPYCMYSDGVGYVRQCVVSVNGSMLTSSNWNGAEFSATGNISNDPGLLAAQTSSAVYAGGNASPNGWAVTGNVGGLGTVMTVTNTGSSPTGIPVVFQGAGAGDHMIGVQVSGDTNPRWKVDTGGDVKWGPGGTDTDVDLGRSGAGSLAVGGGTLGTANVFLRVTGGSAENVVNIGNGAQPATPVGGGYLFVAAGALKYIGSAGTVTAIAPA
jgi:hypothetical protein